jgi:hypothetical protein
MSNKQVNYKKVFIGLVLPLIIGLVATEGKSEDVRAVESNQGFLANEMFCADRGYPLPTMDNGDKNYTKDCYKVGSFTNMERLFPHKKISKSGLLYNLKYSEKPSSHQLSTAVHALIDSYPLTSLIITKNNKIITEYYGYGRKPQQHFASFSMHKSLNALLIGIALEKKLIKNIEDPIISYVHELKHTGWETVTIQQALTMTSGIKANQKKLILPILFGNETIIESVKKYDERISAAGSIFHYNDANTLVLGQIIERVFKKDWDQVFRDEIWSKIGAEDSASVIISKPGEILTNSFFNARPRDYMRLALLMTNNGKNFLGHQIIPSKWVKKYLAKVRSLKDALSAQV